MVKGVFAWSGAGIFPVQPDPPGTVIPDEPEIQSQARARNAPLPLSSHPRTMYAMELLRGEQAIPQYALDHRHQLGLEDRSQRSPSAAAIRQLFRRLEQCPPNGANFLDSARPLWYLCAHT
jgi:hypothetical protein